MASKACFSNGEIKRMIKRFSTSKYVIVFRLNLSRSGHLNYKRNNVVWFKSLLSESKECNKPPQIFAQNIDWYNETNIETSKNYSIIISEPVHGIQRFQYVFMLNIICYDGSGNQQFDAIQNSLLANITHGSNDWKTELRKQSSDNAINEILMKTKNHEFINKWSKCLNEMLNVYNRFEFYPEMENEKCQVEFDDTEINNMHRRP